MKETELNRVVGGERKGILYPSGPRRLDPREISRRVFRVATDKYSPIRGAQCLRWPLEMGVEADSKAQSTGLNALPAVSF